MRITRWCTFFDRFVRISDRVKLSSRDFRRIYKRALGSGGGGIQALYVRWLKSTIYYYSEFICRLYGWFIDCFQIRRTVLLVRVVLINNKVRRTRYQVSNYVVRTLILARVRFTRVRNKCTRSTPSESRRYHYRRGRHGQSVLASVECFRKLFLPSGSMVRGRMWGYYVSRREWSSR